MVLWLLDRKGLDVPVSGIFDSNKRSDDGLRRTFPLPRHLWLNGHCDCGIHPIITLTFKEI